MYYGVLLIHTLLFVWILYFWLMKLLRKLLFPFSIIYGIITGLRNLLYDNGILKSNTYDTPIICVGNLSTGGTGKSPMIEYLISFLKSNHNLAVLSRGYKRKTKGYFEVCENSIVNEVGDEPLQFKKKYPEIHVAVSELRSIGIDILKKSADVILLDDAFQHRKVNASLNIILTSYGDLYVDDYLLPAGNLREPRSGAERAQIIVVTKCPESLGEDEIVRLKKKLKPKTSQEIYFTKIGYSSEIKSHHKTESLDYLIGKNFVLVTGIANPAPLIDFLLTKGLKFEQRIFPDHHNFSSAQLTELKQHELILTTEKDFMRLQAESGFNELFYLPIQTLFLNNEENNFQIRIEKALQK